MGIRVSTLWRVPVYCAAAILSALSLALTLARLYPPDFSVSFLARLYVHGWDAPLASLLVRLTGRTEATLLSAALPPFLFVPFGRKSA